MTTEPPQPDDSESLLAGCCRELGVSEPMAIDIIGWSEERFGVPINGSGGSSIMESFISIEQMARCLLKFKQPYMPMRVLFWALDSRVLDDALGHVSPTEIAKQCGCTKQNVAKTFSVIQAELNLQPRKTQRTAEARHKMSVKRKNQFK